jgi:hypothetical protein
LKAFRDYGSSNGQDKLFGALDYLFCGKWRNTLSSRDALPLSDALHVSLTCSPHSFFLSHPSSSFSSTSEDPSSLAAVFLAGCLHCQGFLGIGSVCVEFLVQWELLAAANLQ